MGVVTFGLVLNRHPPKVMLKSRENMNYITSYLVIMSVALKQTLCTDIVDLNDIQGHYNEV